MSVIFSTAESQPIAAVPGPPPAFPLDEAQSVHALGMTLAEFSRWRQKHPQAMREVYRSLMRRGEGIFLPDPTRITRDGGDGTVKFCLPAGASTAGLPLESESVIIPMKSYRGSQWFTLCISSQIGCRMGCTFCETGRMGLIKNLSAGEIVRQRLMAMRLRTEKGDTETRGRRDAANEQPEIPPQHSALSTQHSVRPQSYFADGIQNIVFMGMGEPLDNFENVTQAVRVLSEPAGMNFPHAQITVSTVGRIDGLKKLAALNWTNLRIAISLNAAHDRLRDELMPINRGMPLADLKQTLLEYPLAPRGRFLIEYVLIKGVNDSLADARAVAEFCAGLRCIVNLIPYNPQRFASFETPSEAAIMVFLQELKGRGIFVKRRITHGRELMGACGQLGNPEIRRQPAPRVHTSLPMMPQSSDNPAE